MNGAALAALILTTVISGCGVGGGTPGLALSLG